MYPSPPSGAQQSIILPPLTPSELLQHLTAHTTYPTTVIISWPKEQFLTALIQDIEQQAQSQDQESDSSVNHPLLLASLFQTAIARHLNIVFAPTVAHLRAYLATMTLSEARIPPPPVTEPRITPSQLVVYGFIELHRDGMAWSAQGLSFSAAVFVESAWRNGFQAVILEPRSTQGGSEELDHSLAEKVPVLRGTPVRDGRSWGGPIVEIGQVLGSWFEVDVKMEFSKAHA